MKPIFTFILLILFPVVLFGAEKTPGLDPKEREALANLAAGKNQLELGSILGIFPEPELALVNFKHRPKSWLDLAEKEPEICLPDFPGGYITLANLHAQLGDLKKPRDTSARPTPSTQTRSMMWSLMKWSYWN